jgi:hypothetical protein
MQDVEIALENKTGTLALMGETLGQNQISLEGGGVFYNGAFASAHFLVEDAQKAKQVLGEVGIAVVKISEVIIQKLRQDQPGQLGMFCRRLASAGVNILTQYSDHANQLVSAEWMKEWW